MLSCFKYNPGDLIVPDKILGCKQEKPTLLTRVNKEKMLKVGFRNDRKYNNAGRPGNQDQSLSHVLDL